MTALRYAARSLSRQPAFLMAAVATLALGIGATSAIFSMVDAVLLAPLPYASPDRLLLVRQRAPDGEQTDASITAAAAWRAQSPSLAGLALYQEWRRILSDAGAPEELRVLRVESNLFPLLGVSPLLGPGLGDEHRSSGGREDAVVLSWSLWQRRFGGDPSIIGRTIVLQETPHTVVGVMPRDFEFPIDAQIAAWTPLVFPSVADLDDSARHLEFDLPVYGAVLRLREGAAAAKAEAELAAITSRVLLSAGWQDEPRIGWSAGLTPLRDAMIGSGRGLEILFAAVLLVLLIACANVANLFIVRGIERQREFGVRLALGARRRDLLVQLGAEGLLVAGTGLLLGVMLAAWLTDLLVLLDPGDLPRWQSIDLDARSLAFTAALGVLATLLGGVLPALLVARVGPGAAASDGGRAGFAPSRTRIRRVLIVAELVVSFVLFAGAALLLRSYVRVQSVDPGFQAEGLLTARLVLPPERYGSFRDRARVNLFYDELLSTLRATPGVRSAGAVSTLPLSEAGTLLRDTLTRADASGPVPVFATLRFATPGYFETLGATLRGRDFAVSDGPGSARVAIVNRTLARRLFADADPIGRTIRTRSREVQVIGVIEDVRHEGLDTPAGAEWYEPASQFPYLPGLLVAVRTAGSPAAFAGTLEAAVHAIDPRLPVANLSPMTQLVSRTLARRRFNATLLGGLAALGLNLLAVGVYGVMAHGVAQRSSELALRLALGAGRAHVARLVMGDALRLTLAGTAIGLVLALLSARLLRGLLFQVSPLDPLALAVAAVLLLLTALLAAALPARRAARTPPFMALRS